MKRNRIGMLLALVASAGLLCGCMDMQNLTEDEEDMIAEYSAGVLLRYSDRYDLRLVTSDQEEQEEVTATSNPTATPEPSNAPSETSTDDEGTDDRQTDTETSTLSLNDLYHVQGLKISYDSYKFCSKYPEKASGGISPVTAGKDEVLLVVSFSIKNNSGKKKHVQLGKRNIQYTLNIDGLEFQPDISILDNMGMNYLDTTVAKNRTEKAVLIFTLSKERKSASNISLSVQDGDSVAGIQLK